MGLISNVRLFSIKNQIKIALYSFGSVVINKIPKGLKNTYEFIRELKSREIIFKRTKDGIAFKYDVNNQLASFLISENSSDSDVFEQIILNEEYKSIVELFLRKGWQLNNMVDAGANVGFTSVYFKRFFPSVAIVAIEPNKKTFKRLEYNIRANGLDHCTLLNIGLWSSRTNLKSDHTFRDGQDWAYRLVDSSEIDEKSIKVISMNEVLEERNWKIIDFLKVDIEGGEDAIFKDENTLGWLDKIKVLAVEIHDEFNCRERIERMLQQRNFSLSHSGELTVAINQSLI